MDGIFIHIHNVTNSKSIEADKEFLFYKQFQAI